MGLLFGTDGIRGRANAYPITPEVALNAGRAVARMLGAGNGATFLIGNDSRLSGKMIESALASGICSAGGHALLGGVLPTPAVAHLASAMGYAGGVVISASHNPYYDNGIKIFDNQGFKLSADMEDRIEEAILKYPEDFTPAHDEAIGTIRYSSGFEEQYAGFIAGSGISQPDLSGMKIVLDCSNGATYRVAAIVFERLKADVKTLFDHPDGLNINDNCGSQHVETLCEKVVATGADVGLAFDGDGDRLIAVDEAGGRVTGDQVLAICARQMKKAGQLANNLVVSTVMSNVGLRNLLAELDIRHRITDVGDRHVLAEMLKSGAVIGGEDSGHMIFLDRHTSGDGILTGLRLIEAMKETGRPLSELASIMTVYPQVLKNVRINEKTDIYTYPDIAAVIKDVEKRLDGQGRVLVRYSGTQPLCRIMVEGPDRNTTEGCCNEIVDVIDRTIGAGRDG